MTFFPLIYTGLKPPKKTNKPVKEESFHCTFELLLHEKSRCPQSCGVGRGGTGSSSQHHPCCGANLGTSTTQCRIPTQPPHPSVPTDHIPQCRVAMTVGPLHFRSCLCCAHSAEAPCCQPGGVVWHRGSSARRCSQSCITCCQAHGLLLGAASVLQGRGTEPQQILQPLPTPALSVQLHFEACRWLLVEQWETTLCWKADVEGNTTNRFLMPEPPACSALLLSSVINATF